MTRLEKEAVNALQKDKRGFISSVITGTPTRFRYAPRPLKGRRGLTKKSYMVPVKAGEPGYDDAPFEATIIWHKP